MEDHFYYFKFKEVFEKNRNDDRAIKMKAYMKNHFEFYGLDSATRKQLTSSIIKEFGKPNQSVLLGLTGLLWSDPHREMQYTAMLLNDKMLRNLDESFAYYYDKLIGQKSWWDSVDWLAPTGMGTLLKRYTTLQSEFIEKWMASGNRWYIRSALLFQLKYKLDTDFELVKELILRSSGTKEFFINKAAGWILREYSKTNAEPVIQFIEAHPELHNLTKKEGLKWLVNKGVIVNG